MRLDRGRCQLLGYCIKVFQGMWWRLEWEDKVFFRKRFIVLDILFLVVVGFISVQFADLGVKQADTFRIFQE